MVSLAGMETMFFSAVGHGGSSYRCLLPLLYQYRYRRVKGQTRAISNRRASQRHNSVDCPHGCRVSELPRCTESIVAVTSTMSVISEPPSSRIAADITPAASDGVNSRPITLSVPRRVSSCQVPIGNLKRCAIRWERLATLIIQACMRWRQANASVRRATPL